MLYKSINVFKKFIFACICVITYIRCLDMTSVCAATIRQFMMISDEAFYISLLQYFEFFGGIINRM